jgi:hypothetical protein
MALYNPALGNPAEYRFQSGQFAGMTVQEVQNFIRQRQGQLNQVTGANQKPSTVSGSSQGDQALGLVGGIGGAAALRYYLGSQGTQALAQTGGQALAQTGGQALAQGGAQAANASANTGAALANSSAQTANAVNTGVTGYSNTASTLGGGVGAGIAPYVGAAAFAYNQYQNAPGAYQSGTQYDMPQQAAWENYKDSWSNNKSAGDWAKKALDVVTFQDLYNGGYAALGSMFGSKRKIDRDLRKSGRKGLKDMGIVDQDSSERYNLASGNQFNIRDFKNQTGGDAYNIDWNDSSLNRDKVAFLDAISTARMGNKGKVGKASSDITGELYNAAKSDGNFDGNVRFYGDKAGGRDRLYAAIADQWSKNKSITADKRDAMFAAIDKEYGIANPNNNRWDASLTGKDAERNLKEFQEADKKRAAAAQKAPANTKPVVQVGATTNTRLKGK